MKAIVRFIPRFLRVDQFFLYLRMKRLEDSSKFGTFYGVFLPGIMTMIGAMVFLRLGWVIGAVGISQAFLILALALAIALITVLSVMATATNRDVGGGGTYYMISRSFGVEIGAAIGLPLFVAQVITIAFCAIGFADAFCELFPMLSPRIVGIVSLVGISAITYFSSNLAMKAQLFVFALIALALCSFFSGHEYTGELGGGTSASYPFWAVFAIFFPAATGLEGAIGLSGNLRNPRRSIPLGSLSVIFVSFAVYIAMACFLWKWVPREVLVGDPMILHKIARFAPIIHVGVWVAALSTSLAGLLAAPRTLQALARDEIIPKFFGKEGKSGIPQIATIATAILALGAICFGSLNLLASISTMFLLIAYGMLNLAAGLEDFLGHPSWRPSIPVPWTVSFSGALICFLVMLMINSGATIIAIVCILAIYLFNKRRRLAPGWDDIRQGILLFLSRFAIYRLAFTSPSSRSWRPNFLILTSSQVEGSAHLLSFANAIGRGRGFMTLAAILPTSSLAFEKQHVAFKAMRSLLKKEKAQALIEIEHASEWLKGAKRMINHYGLGHLKPDTVLLSCSFAKEFTDEYARLLEIAWEKKRNVLLFSDGISSLEQYDGIDIWWDEHNKANSDLMLLLAHMLQKRKVRRVNLKCVVGDENAKGERERYFLEFAKVSRLSLSVEVIVSTSHEETFEQMQREHRPSRLLMTGIRPPASKESFEHYARYCSDWFSLADRVPEIAFVMHASRLELKEIFS